MGLVLSILAAVIGIAYMICLKEKKRIAMLLEQVADGFKELDDFNVDEWKREHEEKMQLLRDVSSDLDSLTKNVGIATTSGGSASIVGGLLAGLGMFAAPFTFGGSLALTGAGIALGVSGGITSLVSGIVEREQHTSKLENVKCQIDNYNLKTMKLHKIIANLIQSLKKLGKEIDLEKLLRNDPNLSQDVLFVRLKELYKVACQIYSTASSGRRIYDVTRMGYAITRLSRSLTFSPDFLQLTAGRLAAPARPLQLPFQAGALGAKVVGGASIVIGIGFGVWDVCKGAIAIQDGSKAANELQKVEENLQHDKRVLVEAIDALRRP